MKKVKIIMATFLLAGITATGFAQETDQGRQMDPETRAEKEVEMISKAIPDLSDKQRKQIKDASLQQHKNMLELRAEQKENREAFREKVKEMRMEKRNSYKEILSKDQYIQLLETSQERKANRGRKGMHHRKGKEFKGKGHMRNNDRGQRGPRP